MNTETVTITLTKALIGYDWAVAGREDDLYGYVEYDHGYYHAIHADDAGEPNIPTGIGRDAEAAVRELLDLLDEQGRLDA